MKSLFLSSLLLSFLSCNAYRGNIDCPIGEGIHCTPTREIIKMIDETGASDDPLEDTIYEFAPKEKSHARSIP